MEDPAVLAPGSSRVLISYAHDDPAHEGQVLEFSEFLRANGVDALIDVAVNKYAPLPALSIVDQPSSDDPPSVIRIT